MSNKNWKSKRKKKKPYIIGEMVLRFGGQETIKKVEDILKENQVKKKLIKYQGMSAWQSKNRKERHK